MDATLSFGTWLKQRRKALDLTQAELARRVGCAKVTLQKIELEERRPSREIAVRLAEILEVIPADRDALSGLPAANSPPTGSRPHVVSVNCRHLQRRQQLSSITSLRR